MALVLSLLLLVNLTSYELSGYIFKELQIDRPVYILYLPDSDIPIEGYVCENIDGSFSIYVKKNIPKTLAIRTIFHEAVHIRQIIDGRLIYLDNKGFRVKWCGEIYNERSDFHPWEIEANKLSGHYLRRIRKNEGKYF